MLTALSWVHFSLCLSLDLTSQTLQYKCPVMTLGLQTLQPNRIKPTKDEVTSSSINWLVFITHIKPVVTYKYVYALRKNCTQSAH